MADYFVCPICGTDVPTKSKVCTECGSDENTGWSEDTMYDGLDLPDLEEPSTQASNSIFQNKYIFYFVAFITILAFLLFYLR